MAANGEGNMEIHIPRVVWSGPKARLHLRMIDGTVCLFDDQGRMVEGVRGLSVRQARDGATDVDVSLHVFRPEARGERSPSGATLQDIQAACASDPRLLRKGAG